MNGHWIGPNKINHLFNSCIDSPWYDITLLPTKKGFKKVLGLKYSYEYVELYQKCTGDELPSLKRSFLNNHDLPDHQTSQETPLLISDSSTAPGLEFPVSWASGHWQFGSPDKNLHGWKKQNSSRPSHVFGEPFVLYNSVGYSTKLHRQMRQESPQSMRRNHPGGHQVQSSTAASHRITGRKLSSLSRL